jgi:succinoglycan biosynthesis transport protein ExoP
MQNSTELIASPSTLAGHYSGVLPRKEMTVQDLWGILSRRRRVIVSVLSLALLIAALLYATATRMYKASAQVEVQKETADTLSLDSKAGTESATDSLELSTNLQTEAQILQSESLALNVINSLKIENTPDFQPKFSLIGWALGLFSPGGVSDPMGVSLADAPGRRGHALKIFEKNLKVKPIAGTRLIGIDYFSSDPRTAAAVVNSLITNLNDYNFESQHAPTQQAATWLTKQLFDLRKHSEDLQAKVVEMQRDSGVFTLGQTDSQGREQVYTPVLDRLQQATSHLAEAQSARIMKGALYEVVKNGDPELISGLAGNGTLSGASSGVSGSLSLLQGLRSQESQAQAQMNELSAKFGPGYSKLGEIQASLSSIHKAILDEAGRIAARVKNDYAVSQQIEDNDRAVFLQEKNQAESLNSKAIEYEIARQEAVQSRNLYENLLQRLKEADLVAGLHSSNITVVDPARAPSRPAKPNILIYAAAGIVGGFLLAICTAVFRDATDSRIQDFSEVEVLGNATPIGFLPHHAAQAGWKRLPSSRKQTSSLNASSSSDSLSEAVGAKFTVAAAEPHAAYTEALRALRTSLMRSGRGAPPPQVILITSSIPGEGKSMLSLNLAIVYAQSRKKVLLVDGDLRTPVLHQHLGLSSTKGLSSLLMPRDSDTDPLQPVRLSLEGAISLDVIPAGSVTTYPAELLDSDEMEEMIGIWRNQYDYIFIDGAPLLPVTDSALLSRYADFTLVVARQNMTDRRSLERTTQILRSQGLRNTGIVLNGVKAGGGAQHRYYGYKHTGYYGRESHA